MIGNEEACGPPQRRDAQIFDLTIAVRPQAGLESQRLSTFLPGFVSGLWSGPERGRTNFVEMCQATRAGKSLPPLSVISPSGSLAPQTSHLPHQREAGAVPLCMQIRLVAAWTPPLRRLVL